jgi:DMSO/TMAO reductase YedYZ molybdopterin-dependent catalytic subunit
MRIRARRSIVALVLTGGVLLAGGTAAVAAPAVSAQHAAAVVAKKPVSRFVAWQACSAATWRWVAENAAHGTEVDTHFNRYKPSLEWRKDGAWVVQIAGKAHERVTAHNRSSFCVVKGTNAHPKIVDRAFPR